MGACTSSRPKGTSPVSNLPARSRLITVQNPHVQSPSATNPPLGATQPCAAAGEAVSHDLLSTLSSPPCPPTNQPPLTTDSNSSESPNDSEFERRKEGEAFDSLDSLQSHAVPFHAHWVGKRIEERKRRRSHSNAADVDQSQAPWQLVREAPLLSALNENSDSESGAPRANASAVPPASSQTPDALGSSSSSSSSESASSASFASSSSSSSSSGGLLATIPQVDTPLSTNTQATMTPVPETSELVPPNPHTSPVSPLHLKPGVDGLGQGEQPLRHPAVERLKRTGSAAGGRGGRRPLHISTSGNNGASGMSSTDESSGTESGGEEVDPESPTSPTRSIRISMRKERRRKRVRRFIKSNSTSSLFVKNTMAFPNSEQLITAVSAEVYRTINQTESWPTTGFDEPELVTLSNAQNWKSDVESVVYFVDFLFTNGKLRPYCLLMCLVYLERFLKKCGFPLTQANWRPVTMIALLISSKAWDDCNIINLDCHEMFPHIGTLKQVNKWEALFMGVLDWDVSVTVAPYAKVYFRLYHKLRLVETRAEFMQSRPATPLSVDAAIELDAISNPGSRKNSPASVTRKLGAQTMEDYDLTMRPQKARAVVD